MNKIGLGLSNLFTRFGWWRQRKFYHNSVETLPIGAWWKLQETSDFSWLIDDSIWGKIKRVFWPIFREDFTEKSFKIYEKVINTYIKYIGIGEQQEEIIRLKLKLHALYCAKIATGDRNKNNWIRITKSQITAIEKKLANDTGSSNEETIEYLEDDRPIHIDIWKTTVVKFHAQMKHYSAKKKREIANLNKESA